MITSYFEFKSVSPYTDAKSFTFGPSGELIVSERDKISKWRGTYQKIAGTDSWLGFSGDGGLAVDAKIYALDGQVLASKFGDVYFSDTGNHCVRKILTNGTIISIAGVGGSKGYNSDAILATTAKLNQPTGLIFSDSDESGLIIFDKSNHRIRKVDFESGLISTIAGDGTASFSGDDLLANIATLNKPYSGMLNDVGELVFTDSGNNRIRKIDSAGYMSTIAGGGILNVTLESPQYLKLFNNCIYFGENGLRVRRINKDGSVETLFGYTGSRNEEGFDANMADFDFTNEFSVFNGTFLIQEESRLRKIDSNNKISTIAGLTQKFKYAYSTPDGPLNIDSNIFNRIFHNLIWEY